MGDEPREADGVDRHVAVHELGRALRRPGGRVELAVVVELDDLGAGHEARRLGGEAHHQHRADGEVRGGEDVGGRAARAGPERVELGRVEPGRAQDDVHPARPRPPARCRAPCRAA